MAGISSVICMCNRCFELYNIENLRTDRHGYLVAYCPKYDCDGTVYPIDELIVPMIRKLNKSGFVTRYCCAGHPASTVPENKWSYISFSDESPRIYMEKPPKLWYWDDNCLRSENGNIYQRMINLDEWVDELIRRKECD